MTRLRLGILAAVSILSTVVANAQPAAIYNWTGVYIGGNVGAQQSNTRWNFPDAANSTASTSQKYTNAIYGAQAGAQYQWQQWVIGVEGAYSANTRFDSRYSSSCNFPVPFDDRCDGYVSRGMFTFGGRLGYSPTSWDRLLIFATGGGAWTDIKTAIRFGGVGVPPPLNAAPVATNTSSNQGYYFGGGFEYALSRMWVIGAEYQRVEFDGESQCIAGVIGGCAPSILNRNVKQTVDLARMRLSWRPF